MAAEADWPDAYRVNRFVRGESNDATPEEALADFRRFPAWMWRNVGGGHGHRGAGEDDGEEFVERVAQKLGVTSEDARKRLEAVFDVMREAVTPGELHDVLVQLPSGSAELLL